MKKFCHIILLFWFAFFSVGKAEDSIRADSFITIDMRDGLSESRIRQIKQMPDGRIAVATTATIDIYDDTRFVSFKLMPGKAHPLSGYHGKRQLNCDSLGFLWLRNENVLYVLDTKKGEVVSNVDSLLLALHLTNQDIISLPESPIPNNYGDIHDVFTIEHDTYGGIWIGTKENGILYRNPLRARQFYTSPTEFAYPRIANHGTTRARNLEDQYAPHATNCMLDDDGDYAYLGTLTGLMIFNRENKLVTILDEKQGFHSNNVQSLIRDDNGDVWLTTSNGISRIHLCGVDSFEITNFGKLDGISIEGREFRPGQINKSPSGLITAGFVGGTVTFYPDSVTAPRFCYYYPAPEPMSQHSSNSGKLYWIILAILVIALVLSLYYHSCHRHKKNQADSTRVFDSTPQMSEEAFKRIKEQRNEPTADELFLARLQQIVEENIGKENFSVQSLSECMAMDRTGLFRRMKNLTGLSPSDYIRKIRVDVVARLLTETDWPISDIAKKTGFSTTKYCRKVFKGIYSVMPEEYRNGHSRALLAGEEASEADRQMLNES